jgi:branched-chain amino acid transport system permease protein
MVIGALCQRVAIQPILHKDEMSLLLVTFAIGIFIVNAVQLAAGPTPVRLASPFQTPFTFADLFLTGQKLFILAFGSALIAAVALLVRRSSIGKVLRLIILIACGIFAMLASSLNLVIGELGELSLGHGALFGFAAYASAILTKTAGLPFLAALPLAVLLTGAVGAFIAWFSFRLRGGYFAIVTLASAEILRLVATNWMDLTRGPMGFSAIPAPSLLGIEVSTNVGYYFLVLGALGLVLLLLDRLRSSRWGRAFVSIRENGDLARSIGIDVFRHKVLAFTISAMVAAVPGSLYAHFYKILMPETLGLSYTTTALIMVMVGGRGTMVGPLVGSLIFTVLPETLRMAGELRMLFFAALLAASCIFTPEGIVRAAGSLARRLAGPPHPDPAPPAERTTPVPDSAQG